MNSDMIKSTIELPKLIAVPSSPNSSKPTVGSSTVYLMDCVAGMKEYPDKYFDLAVVDPPYGINATSMNLGNRQKKLTKKNWDIEPPKLEYFYELFRCSKEQVVFGANHFISRMPYDSSCWLVWDKNNGDSDFADGEMAWTSFKKPMKIRKIHWCGSASKWEDTNGKIHPTQKPLELYDWVFTRFAEKGQRILDTHLGSQSSRIAADKAGLDFTGFEIDKEYFDAGEKRFKDFKSQLRIEGW